MGKIRTRFIGDVEVEEKQKKEQKKRAEEKKLEKKKDVAPVETEIQESRSATEPELTKTEPAEQTKKKKNKKTASTTAIKTRGKKYQEALKKVDGNKSYELNEAVALLKKIAYATFEESVELHLNVVSAGMKGEIELPHSTGKTVRVAIASDDLLEDIGNGNVNFDVLIAHPSFMPKLAKYARTLGPKGLMPNPKAGTISPKPEEAAKKFEKGTLRWKTEAKTPIVHQLVAKLPHETKHIVENAEAFIAAVGQNNITSAFIKTTMSPSLKVKLNTV